MAKLLLILLFAVPMILVIIGAITTRRAVRRMRKDLRDAESQAQALKELKKRDAPGSDAG
jgi:cytochrome c-type biogenesis protein CcmH/NrfF